MRTAKLPEDRPTPVFRCDMCGYYHVAFGAERECQYRESDFTRCFTTGDLENLFGNEGTGWTDVTGKLPESVPGCTGKLPESAPVERVQLEMSEVWMTNNPEIAIEKLIAFSNRHLTGKLSVDRSQPYKFIIVAEPDKASTTAWA